MHITFPLYAAWRVFSLLSLSHGLIVWPQMIAQCDCDCHPYRQQARLLTSVGRGELNLFPGLMSAPRKEDRVWLF